MSEIEIYTPEACFALAERVASSALMPVAYRNKPTDAAIAMLYGVEMGMSPMTSLQRIVVINGKPTLDAQGMVALIRQAGHSISGDVTPEKATVKGKRGDTGDEMTSTFSMDDAKLAGLAGSATYKKYPKDMLWARAVSQLGRRLFADVLMAASYGPEEMQSVVGGSLDRQDDEQAPAHREVANSDESALISAEEIAEVFDAEVLDAEVVPEPPAASGGSEVSEKQLKFIHVLLKSKGHATGGEKREAIEQILGREVPYLEQISKRDASTIIESLQEEALVDAISPPIAKQTAPDVGWATGEEPF